MASFSYHMSNQSSRECENECGVACREIAIRSAPDLHTVIYRCRKIKSCIEDCKTNCNMIRQDVQNPKNPGFMMTSFPTKKMDDIDFLIMQID